jgi:phosphate transport system substrate-binding protein
VQEQNPARGIALTEVEEVYAGKRKTWSDGTPIRLVLRPLSDGLSQYLAGISPGLKWASVKAHSIPGMFVGMTDQEAAAQIERMPGAFGITSASLVTAEKRRIKALAVDGAAPTLSNLATGTYPYAVTLYLVYKRDDDETRDFVEFVFSADGQRLLAENGHVTLPRGAKK